MISLPGHCQKIMAMLNDAGYECYVVGGAVRDLVMGNTPSDYDLTTSATPDEMISIFEENGIRYLPTGIRHGTVTALISGNQVEITTFRVDGSYADHRRPEHVDFTASIEEDVKRRDFTINAMYLDKDGRTVDLAGGLDDIDRRLIRAVGDPHKRFEEDALRIMRGLRFAAVTGFDIDDNTFTAMCGCAQLLDSIAGERIAVELNGLVTAPFATWVIRRSVPVLKMIIPELEECRGFDQKSPYHDKDVFEHTLAVLDNISCSSSGRRDTVLALAALFHDIAKPKCIKQYGHMKAHPAEGALIADRVLTKLHYSNSIRNETVKLIRDHDIYVNPDRISVHRFISERGKELLDKLIILQCADILAHSDEGKQRLEHLDKLLKIGHELTEEDAAFSISELKISGQDVINIGIDPGPEVGKILGRLFEDHINDLVPNERRRLMGRLKFIIC